MLLGDNADQHIPRVPATSIIKLNLTHLTRRLPYGNDWTLSFYGSLDFNIYQTYDNANKKIDRLMHIGDICRYNEIEHEI